MTLLRHWCWREALLCVAVCLALVCIPRVLYAASEETSLIPHLQQLIDDASEGGTLVLPAGSYRGGVSIGKPLTVRAEGTVRIIAANSTEPAVRIDADHVRLQQVQLIQPFSSEAPALLVNGSKAVLDSIGIRTRSFGIMLRDNGQNEIFNSTIQREPDGFGAQADSRNGIDLFNSHDNRIYNNTISTMNDGIYLESSHRNRVERNRIDGSRYGIHCMYTDGTVVRDNEGSLNVTGAMIMGVKDAEVTGNTFVKQSESVNSQGLLLFDVQTSRIEGNKAEGNRVGFYIEQSHRNRIANNDLVRNFVGVQLLESDENEFTGNYFWNNVIESEADESRSNRFAGNYWDAFRGIDPSGDGISDISYAMNPFFQKLTSAIPAFQLFFQSPGMLFLESMQTAGIEEWTVDPAPLMKPEAERLPVQDRPGQAGLLASAVMLLLASITIITYTGGKRR